MKLLGIDIGTGGSRAVLIDDVGRVVASATAEHEAFSSPVIGWAEQDPEDWWRAASTAIQKICSENPSEVEDLVAIGLSGQMHGAVLLNGEDRVVRPAIIWCDQRTEKQCVGLNKKVGHETLRHFVGNPALPNMTLPKFLWVRENEPEYWEQVSSVMLPKDYVRFKMTGEKATDVSDASGTLLLDVENRKWSKRLLEKVSIDDEILPALYESHEISGTISKECASETGLKIGIPVVAGAGDNAAGAIGMGIVYPGDTSVTIGTSGVAFTVMNKPKIDLKGRIHSFCHAIPDRWHLTAVTQAAGLSLKWFRDNFGNMESYEDLDAMATDVKTDSDDLLWTPYLMGERAPHLDSNVRASLVGLTTSHTKAHVVRAIMEGVAFSLKDCLEIFKELEIEVGDILLGGGGASSALWRQIQADVYGRPVKTIDVEEGAAFGVALLAGVGIKHWESIDEACTQTIRLKPATKPNLASVDLYSSRYQSYRKIYPALSELFEKK